MNFNRLAIILRYSQPLAAKGVKYVSLFPSLENAYYCLGGAKMASTIPANTLAADALINTVGSCLLHREVLAAAIGAPQSPVATRFLLKLI